MWSQFLPNPDPKLNFNSLFKPFLTKKEEKEIRQTMAVVRQHMQRLMRQDREMDPTTLAETTAEDFDVDQTGGPLDDPSHWIWDLAADLGHVD